MKTKIKRILVPLDFSETSELALSEAILLASKLKADLFLIYVVELSGFYFSVIADNRSRMPTLKEAEKLAQKRIEKLCKSIKKSTNLNVEAVIGSGTIYKEIIRYSEKKQIDLIVMGTHGLSGYKEMFVGSNTQRVVTLSDIPVLTMQKAINKSGFRNILLPIDNSMHSREKINMTMVFADLFGSTIHIMGLPDSDEKQALNKFKIKLDSVEDIIKADHLKYKTTLVHGKSLAKTAMKYASENKCDLIVINTGHESKVTGIFLGAFAQQLVNHSKIPVLSCRHMQGHYDINTPAFGIG